jgi:hypothetical protein
MTNTFNNYKSNSEFLHTEIYSNLSELIEKSYSYKNFRYINGPIKLQNTEYVLIRDTFYVLECIFNFNNKNYHGIFYSDGQNYVKQLIDNI